MDECLSGNHTCDLNASCLNSKGSYTCHCNDGYNGDGVTCIDVDECSGVNTCSDNSSCKNTKCGYDCTCNDGFIRNGQECVDINE